MADNQFIARKGLISLDDSQITGSLSITNAVTASIFTGSFVGDGSQLSGVSAGFPFTGSAQITGSLVVTGSVTATSFIGDGSQLTGIDDPTPITVTINNTNSPFTITNQSIVIIDSTDGDVTVNLPDLDVIDGTPNQKPILLYKNDYSQNVVYVQPNGSQLVNGTTQDIIVSIQIGIVYNPTSAGWVTEGTSYQSLAELELFFVPRTETGSLSVSTASYVDYTNVANKPSLVSGSSQITYSGLTGIPSGIVSSSAQVLNYGIFATTGSNGFNGNQSITGSLTVTGQVVAQTLNVQQVTSSIVYSSGSNIFGNSLSNTQQFTGSVSVTGSLSVNGTSAVVGSGTTNYIPKFTGASIIGNSVIYDNGNQIGIGQTTLFSKFSIADSLSATSVDSNYNPGILNIQNTNTTNGNISLIGFQDASAFINLAAIGSINEVHSSSPNNVKGSLSFYTKNNGTSYITEKMRLDASGNLGIGTTDTQTFRLAVDGPNVSQGDTNTTIRIFDTTSATTGTGGGISFAGYFNGTTSFANTLSYIKGGKENSTSDNYAAYLAFGTRTNGGAPTERVRINSDGNFLVGATNADVGGTVKGAIIRQDGSIVSARNTSSPFHYQSPIAADRMNTMGDGVMYSMWRQGIFQAGIGATNASAMTFFTGDNSSMTERMRIASDGTKYFGNSTGSRFQMNGAGENLYQYTNNYYIWGLYNDANSLSIESAFGGNIIFRTANQSTSSSPTTAPERMRIDSGGTVQVRSGNELRTYRSDNTRYGTFYTDNTAVHIAASVDPVRISSPERLEIYTAGTEKVRITSNGNLKLNGTTLSAFTSNPGNVGSGGTTTLVISQLAGQFQSTYLVTINGLYTSGGVNQNGYGTALINFFTDGSVAHANASSLQGNGWGISASATTGGTFTITFTNSASTTMGNIAIRAVKLNMTGGD